MHDQLHSILFFGEGVRNLAPIMAFLYGLSPNIRGLLYSAVNQRKASPIYIFRNQRSR